MKERIRKLWTKALISGDYKQGQGRLRTGNRYCCLGVLCDLYQKDTGKGAWLNVVGTSAKRFDAATNKVSPESNQSLVLPEEVAKWAGLPFKVYENDAVEHGDIKLRCQIENPKKDGPTVKSVAGMNDSGFTFKDIAKAINKGELILGRKR